MEQTNPLPEHALPFPLTPERAKDIFREMRESGTIQPSVLDFLTEEEERKVREFWLHPDTPGSYSIRGVVALCRMTEWSK